MPPLYNNAADPPQIPGGQPGSQGYQGASAQPPGQAFARPSLQSATQKAAPRDQPQAWGQPNLANGGGGAGSSIPSQYLQPGAQRQAYAQRQQQYQQATAGQGGPTGGFFQSQPMQPSQGGGMYTSDASEMGGPSHFYPDQLVGASATQRGRPQQAGGAGNQQQSLLMGAFGGGLSGGGWDPSGGRGGNGGWNPAANGSTQQNAGLGSRNTRGAQAMTPEQILATTRENQTSTIAAIQAKQANGTVSPQELQTLQLMQQQQARPDSSFLQEYQKQNLVYRGQQNEGPSGSFNVGGQQAMYDSRTPAQGAGGPTYFGGPNLGTGGVDGYGGIAPGSTGGGQVGAGGYPQGGGTDPFAASGGGVWTGQQWLPRSHPLAEQFLNGGGGGQQGGGVAGGQGWMGGPGPGSTGGYPGGSTGTVGGGQIGATGIQTGGQAGTIAGGGWMGGPGPGSTGGYPGGSGGQPGPPGGTPIGGTTGGGQPPPGPGPTPGPGPGPGPAPGPGPNGGLNYWEDPNTYQQFQQTLAGAFGQGPGEALPAPTINQPDLSQINALASQGGPAALTLPQQQAWLQAQQAQGPDLGAIQAATGSSPGGLSTPQGQIVDPNQVLGRIGSFSAGNAPSPYQAQNVNVNLPTGQTGYDPQTQALMNQVFTGAGQGLPVEALKQQQTEQALAMQRQQQDQMAQQAAARGTFGSGQQAASERRLASDTQANILGANRDIDIQQALTQQQQRMQAAGLGDQLAQSQFGRGAQAAGLGMQQGFGNQSLQQAAAQSALGGYQAQTGAQLQGRGQDVQSVLAAFGLGQEGSLANAGLSAQVGLGQRGQDVTARGQNLDALLQGQGLATQVGMANAQQANQFGLGQRGQNIDQSNQALQALLGQRGQDITSRGQSMDALLAAQGLGLQGNTANANLAATYNMGTRGQNLDYQQAQNQGLLSSMLGMGNLGQQGAQLGLDRQLGMGNLGVAQQRANQEFQLGQSGQSLQERLAQMQNDTSRYGIDQNTQQLLQQLGFNREQLGLQRELGMGGLDVDRARIGESGRQYNLGNQLGWGNLLNNATIGRLNYGLGLGELEQNGQNQLMQSLFGAL